jgi:hypothetical protein
VSVVSGVVADRVPAGNYAAGEVRVGVNLGANQEEGGAGVEALQEL